jgi:hypothetical protein
MSEAGFVAPASFVNGGELRMVYEWGYKWKKHPEKRCFRVQIRVPMM